MNISKTFLVTGAAFLILGMLIGSYMGGSGDHSLAPVHAHINLLGFTLMSIFGLTYRLVPAMGERGLARVHYWLHLAGSSVLLVLLTMLFTGRLEETSPAMLIAPLCELAIIAGVAIYLWNLVKNYA